MVWSTVDTHRCEAAKKAVDDAGLLDQDTKQKNGRDRHSLQGVMNAEVVRGQGVGRDKGVAQADDCAM